MAIAFTYTESTNIVVVTGGTSGTPADFADFVHFDRTLATAACSIASGAELKAATAVGNPTDLTLTYPMRPVEHKALRLAFTTAANGGAAVSGDETVDIYGTTAVWQKLTGVSANGQKVVPIADLTHNYQVGDTVILIDISAPGTYETDVIASIQEGISITLTNNNTNAYAIGDIVGIYQTEQVDVSAAFATYWSANPYGQIAKCTFTGFDGTNTAKIDQPIWGVIWDYGGGQYKVDAILEFGDESTTTYFTSNNESIYFSDDMFPLILANATLTMGAITAGAASGGSYWSMAATSASHTDFMRNGTFNLYGSIFHVRGTNYYPYFKNGDFNIKQSMILGGSRYYWEATLNSLNVEDLFVSNSQYFIINKSPTIFSNVRMHTITAYIAVLANATLINFNITNISTWVFGVTGGAVLTDRNSVWTVDLAKITTAESIYYEQYTCNIHIVDKDGANLSGVSVACKDTSANAAFITQTTAVDGTITEQNINRRKEDNNVLTNYSPHKFTISKAGYETLVLDTITVDGPIDWHFELQAQKQSPAPWQEGVM